MLQIGATIAAILLVCPLARACTCVDVGGPGVPLLFHNGKELVPMPSEREMREGPLDDAAKKLKVTITLNEKEFYLGQLIHATVTVTNPTSERLRIWEPFGRNTFYLSIYEPCVCGARIESSTRWIEPGETISHVFHSFAPGPDGFVGPQRAGEFTLVYSFRKDEIKFRVVEALK